MVHGLTEIGKFPEKALRTACSDGGPEDTAETSGDQSLAEHLKMNWWIAVDGFSVDASPSAT